VSAIEILEETRKYLTNMLINGFSVHNPTVPIRFANGKFDPETQSKVVIGMTEKPATRISSQLGGKGSRYFGTLVIDATTPKSRGTDEARRYLSQIEDVYWQHVGYVPEAGYIHIIDIDYKDLQEFRGFHTFTMMVNYRLDACK
jgi:hypothetical protein